MVRFLSGLVVGIIVSTIGISGITMVLDNGIDSIKSHAQQFSTKK